MSAKPVNPEQVASDLAELSALSSSLDELVGRVTAMATRYQGSTREEVAHGLYDAERSLLAAGRHLAKVRRRMS